MSALEPTDHRPYPISPGPWVMVQRWHELLFAHWRIEPERLQRLLPEPLEIEVFDGSAWLAVVPFAMTGVRIRGVPAVPRLSDFLELNVRTYARDGDTTGVYFFSLDAESRPAVAGARYWFHLPYFNARMGLRQRADWIDYRSRRVHKGASEARVAVSYRPTGPAEAASPGTLEHFLVERYRLLTNRRDGTGPTVAYEIHHGPWLLQPAEVEFHHNSMADWLGISLDRPPDHVRFARFQHVYIWWPHSLGRARNVGR